MNKWAIYVSGFLCRVWTCFINFILFIYFCLFVLGVMWSGIWGLSSPTRDQSHVPAVQSPNHWPTREVPYLIHSEPPGSINETWVFNEWRISNTMLVSEGARALESSLRAQTLSLPSRTRGVETPWSQRRQNWGLGSAVSWRCDPGHQTLVCKVGRTPASQSPYNFEY